MYDKLMKHTAVNSLVFFVAAMTIMLYLAFTTTAPLPVAQENHVQNTASFSKAGNQELIMEKGGKDETYLSIPLADATKEEQIVLETDDLEEQLFVTIDGQERDFYEKNRICGNISRVKKAVFSYERGVTKLQLQLDGLYEHTAFYKNNMLYVEFTPPRELYEKVIVLDTDGQYGAIPTEIMASVKQKLANEKIKIYDVGLEGNQQKAEKKVRLANNVKADMLITMRAGNEENAGMPGIATVYNGTFFIPVLNSITLSDIMERSIAEATGAYAAGLLEADSADVIVTKATVPVAAVILGNPRDKEMRELLEQEEYQEKLANGIYRGIMNAYRLLEEKE